MNFLIKKINLIEKLESSSLIILIKSNLSDYTERSSEDIEHFQTLEIFIFIWILTLLFKELNQVIISSELFSQKYFNIGHL